jgi:hypothetical protein
MVYITISEYHTLLSTYLSFCADNGLTPDERIVNDAMNKLRSAQ